MESILITAIGSFSADIVIKNLKKIGFRIIGCDIYPKKWIADAYNVSEFYQAPYATNHEEYINFIFEVCRTENIKYIIPLTDIEVDVFNRFREKFEKSDIVICISSKETLKVCRNKQTLAEYIQKHTTTIEIIPTKRISEMKSAPEIYPVVCKPYDGRSSQGLKYIRSKEEWNYFISKKNIDKYIVQPFIQGDIVTVDVVRSAASNQIIAIARKELLRTLNGAGTSVYVFYDSELEQKCCHLAEILNIIGCVNFEFILDEQKNYHFIECNPRFSGGVEFSCIAGFDCIRNHIQSFKQLPLDSFSLQHNMYISRKYEEYITSIE